MTPDLMPCPICGKKPEVTKHFKVEAWGLVHHCRYWGPITFEFTDIETIARRWNHRTA